MTRNQVAYHELQEKIRADRANEQLKMQDLINASEKIASDSALNAAKKRQIEAEVGAMPFDRFVEGIKGVGTLMRGVSGFVA